MLILPIREDHEPEGEPVQREHSSGVFWLVMLLALIFIAVLFWKFVLGT